MKLDGKTAFVTGAGSGLGRAICLAFAAEGARVCVTDIDEDSAAEVAAACGEATEGAFSLRCDVADSASVRAAFTAFTERAGDIDILVNNAGIIHTDPDLLEAMEQTTQAQLMELFSGGPITTHIDTVEHLTDEMFDRMIKIHLYGTFYCTREALPRMRESGKGGRIINMASIMGTASLTGFADYCAAKGGILAFTRAVAREAASYGVLVNAISPGFIDTPLVDPLSDDQKKAITMQIPLGRFGTPEEVAATAVFLAGESGTYFTGQSVSPNGGIYMSQ